MHAEVIIIGAGVAGAGSAYHLANAGCKDVLVLESGKVGVGYEGGSGLGAEAEPRYSGTAVMASPANTVKMVVQLYACSSVEYMRHHGKEGARAYLRLVSFCLVRHRTHTSKSPAPSLCGVLADSGIMHDAMAPLAGSMHRHTGVSRGSLYSLADEQTHGHTEHRCTQRYTQRDKKKPIQTHKRAHKRD